MAAVAASVAKMPSAQEHSPSPQLFYGVKNSTKLTKPAIFLSWNDCKQFVDAEEDFRCFHSIVDAVKYVCNNDLMKQLSEAASLEAANNAKNSSGTLKRKRGRPRKAVVEETSQEETVSGQDSNAKRKRGRPKKVVAENGKKKAATLVDESPKRKRGRPKKVVPEETTNAPDQQEKAAKKDSTAPKKKRGRSRKVIADETTVQEKAASNETTSPPPKKKRGRPRKAETSGAEEETTRPSGEEGTEKENVTPKKKRSRPRKETIEATDQNNTAPPKDSTDAAMEVVEGTSQDEAASMEKKTPKTTPHSSGRYQQKLDLKWNNMLEELKAYKEVHGHTNVPKSYTENELLARWVENQRSCYEKFSKGKHTSMTVERFQALATAGFDFTIPRGRKPEDKKLHNKQWNLRFDDLKQFKAMNGHCNVPMNGCPEFPKLQRWVSSQRALYKRVRQGKQTTLTEERIALLNSVGFTWQVLERMLSWEERYQQLVEYKERFGDCNVKNILEKDNAEGIPHGLGPWVSRQRQLYKKLSLGEDVEFPQEKIDQLNALGFTWQLRKRGPSMLEEPLAGPTPQEEPFFYHVQH